MNVPLQRLLQAFRRLGACFALAAAGVGMAACEPEVSSRSWCERLRAKATQEWTAAELESYVERCLLGEEPEGA